MFCFREVVTKIEKLEEKIDDIFLMEGLLGKVVVEVVDMLLDSEGRYRYMLESYVDLFSDRTW